MFGYVRGYIPELKVREHEYYKGTYCGLCRAMGKCTGQCSRMSLSYDFVAFALLRFALVGETTSFSQKRCILHPLKKRNVMNRNDQLDFCSYASALLTYHKVRDDLCDEGFAKRLFTRVFLLPTASQMRKKTVRKSDSLKELDNMTASSLKRLAEYEESGNTSVDTPAELFGRIMAEYLSFGLDGSNKKIAYNAGLCLGKWIYIADALDDIKEDLEKKRYNPFLMLYNGTIPTADEAAKISEALKIELSELENALDLIDYGNDLTIKNIIYNIIYLGMPRRIEGIVEKLK